MKLERPEDISVSVFSISQAYGVELNLMFGDEPKMSNFITRKGKACWNGLKIQKRRFCRMGIYR